MAATLMPPTARPLACTTVRSAFSSEEARLYGAMIGRTFSTPSPRLQGLDQPDPLVAEGGDDGLVSPPDDLRLHAEGGDVADHVVDLLGRGVGLHHDNHGDPPSSAGHPGNRRTTRALTHRTPMKKAPGTLAWVPGAL